MAMKGRTTCAVPGCGKPLLAPTHLCYDHKVPGCALALDGDVMVITSWYTERAGQAGVVFINDYAIGDLFGGREGFEARLKAQGFEGVYVIGTEEALFAIREIVRKQHKAIPDWSGPWLAKYPWEEGYQGQGPWAGRVEELMKNDPRSWNG